jgi:hypothetical protein
MGQFDDKEDQQKSHRRFSSSRNRCRWLPRFDKCLTNRPVFNKNSQQY